MTFTVTYRGADGALREECVEAASRGECFAQMKARGIVPMSVKEGDSVSRRGRGGRRGEDGGRPRRDASDTRDRKDKERQVPRRMVAFALSVALVALIGGGVWWWMQRDGGVVPDQDEMPKKAALAKEVKPAAAPVAKTVAGTNAAATVQVSPSRAGEAAAPAAGASAPVAPSNRVIVVENDATDPNHKSDFSTGVEQVMGWIFTTELGDSPPPLPDLSAAERKRIVEILLAKNPVEEGDSEKSAEAKEMVSAAKRELMQYLKQGGDTDDFLAFYRNELVKAQEAREDAKRLVREVAREGDDEMTVQFLKEVNGKLAERGIKAVELPVKVRRRLEAAGAATSNTKEEKKQ